MPISETPHPCTSSAHPFGQILILLCYFCITAKKMPCPQNTPLFLHSCITVDQPLRLEWYTLGLLLVYRKCQGESATKWTFPWRARCQFVRHGAHFLESLAPLPPFHSEGDTLVTPVTPSPTRWCHRENIDLQSDYCSRDTVTPFFFN